jgi:hypothetical protein
MAGWDRKSWSSDLQTIVDSLLRLPPGADIALAWPDKGIAVDETVRVVRIRLLYETYDRST